MTMTPFPAAALFDWYDRHARILPWRSRWPDLSPAYHVWLSEIMLQQTVVATVIPYFLDFVRRWPSVCDLAAANNDDVMAAWAGLGYYARARNLHRAAKIVCSDHGGSFPETRDALLALPGVGPYTAGAIAAIGFGASSVVVDGNIERVFARYYAISTPLPAAKADISAAYAAQHPGERPSDYPQALMDFANAVCTPKAPGCDACPVAAGCAAAKTGTPENWPVKAVRKPKPERHGIAFVAHTDGGTACLVKRPENGLLGGMLAFPSAGWTPADSDWNADAPLANPPFSAKWTLLDDSVSHVFTHFSLTMRVAVARIDSVPEGGEMVGGADWPADMSADWQRVRPASLPTLMRKVWKLAEPAVTHQPAGHADNSVKGGDWPQNQ
jgi:A/G-specific adenine glycosylase